MRRTIPAVAAVLLALFAGAAPASATDFGLSSFDVTFTGPDGEAQLQAGSHPYAMNTTLVSNTEETPAGIFPAEAAKDIEIAQPAGLIGAENAVPHCPITAFLTQTGDGIGGATGCPDSTAVGIARTTAGTGTAVVTFRSAIYQLATPPHRAAKFGFTVNSVPVVFDVSLAEQPPYDLLVHARNISQAVELFASEVTLWGVPGDPRHDEERGRCYLGGKSCAGGAPVPLLTLPRACRGPLPTSWAADSWQHPGSYLPDGSPDLADPRWARGEALTHDLFPPPLPQGMSGCGNLSFTPSIAAQPTSAASSSPTGLDFSIDAPNEGLTSAKEGAVASSDIEKAVVTLPEGMSANPALAEGLVGCTEADLARETALSEPGEGCPGASKIGTVAVETPLLEEDLKGALYIAQPYQNPFGTLLAMYVVIQSPVLGIKVVQPLRVEPDPVTGRLTTVAEDMPQVPFSRFKLHFREGARSPLSTPPACGSHPVAATLYPYSGGPPVTSTSSFELISGPDGSGCPSGGLPPFHPGLIAGSINNAAGRFTPFNVRLFRSDAEQEITHFSIKLPPGVVGKLAGIPLCSDAQIAAAKARERQPHGGQEELEAPSCPAASAIGHTLVGSGVGPALTYAPGKVYLAGPYHGSPISVVAITAAKVGPFDLGNVVVREALKVNPETAEVSVDAAGSDPIPHIIDGIPVHLRDIRVYVDRPEFVLNPTGCEPTSTASTLLGSGLDFASEADDVPVTVTTRFQAADCASLGFKPRLKLQLIGRKTHRGALPAFKAVLNARPGDANIGKAQVTLPSSEYLEQGHLSDVCPKSVWTQGSVPGEKCPASSIYGEARAITPLLDQPLEGPVYLRTGYGTKLPELVAALNGSEINVDVVGIIDAVHKKGSEVSRIRTTFKAVPDAPVSKFVLDMKGGSKGLLVNSTDICRSAHRAEANFTGQNGRVHKFHPDLVATGCAKHKKRHKRGN